MGKNKSKSSGGRRPGKGPHPKAGQGKHNSSAAKSRSRSIGSAASLASREDLKSIDDNRSRDGLGGSGDVVHLDDFVATSPPPPSKNSSNENYVNSNSSSSLSFHRATSPLPSTVTIETSIFSPIQEETAASMMGTPSPVAAHSNGSRINNNITTSTKTPFNSPAAAPVSNGNIGVVAAVKEESEPEVTSSPKQPPESSPEPTSPTLGAAAAAFAVDDKAAASSPNANVDVWSSNLKNHVTVEPDGPAVLDVSTDYGSGGGGAGLGISVDDDAPAAAAAKATPEPPAAAAPAAIKSSVKQVVDPIAATVEPVAKEPVAKAAAATANRDFVVDLSAPHPSEVGQQGAARSDDCQCAIL
jgi:hypothetical protein